MLKVFLLTVTLIGNKYSCDLLCVMFVDIIQFLGINFIGHFFFVAGLNRNWCDALPVFLTS